MNDMEACEYMRDVHGYNSLKTQTNACYLNVSFKTSLFLTYARFLTMSVFAYRNMETLSNCCGQLEIPILTSFDRASAGAFPEVVIISELWLSASQKLHPKTQMRLANVKQRKDMI